ncbi:pentatricopeptide repeat-containing protein At1g55890, mitochondrial-like [Macadamia integrifolia]|uniref:pentatricopeptide repeat-containing protein At1g55890, mitochondrial-like n=1 Tax=Macadamia integrifolia TaxID=60698 RepID=UPI001C4FF4D5|nr:pentatricopeptide repeat-containing protein At1g55890, mitochondrial-like [Macadamia integrifolia]XP_042518147.1 pentatricopeptide repeat-containing protein At1g55890, mitochondrial-like [Macadamia integrifolia]XP_042518148.1 pentatricopeptide repeat-containing protein At1g55890, mitochondrial-like [Macadamia integrifolia]
MASLFSLLYRNFCTTTPATTVGSTTLKAIVGDIFKERNFKTLVEKFKKSSESYRFRCKHRIYEVTVRRLASAKRFSDIEEILEDQKKYNDISKEGFAVRLISLYGKSGMFDKASQTFDQLPELKCERTVKSFNALLTACVDTKNFDKVEPLFRELLSSLSIQPDIYSYNIMIHAYCEMGSLDSALKFLDEMEKNGVTPNLVTFNTLLNTFYEKNRFSDGEKIWVRMENNDCVPDIRSFNAKLRGLVLGGETTELVKLVEELATKGPKPDIHTFNALIKGLCNDGQLEAATRIYSELAKNDLTPNRSTFQALVPCLCEKGDFDRALELCKESLNRRCFLDVGLLQTVVDGLVKDSKFDGAKELVELGKERCYGKSGLKMPCDGE